jgi:hypothetical protein
MADYSSIKGNRVQYLSTDPTLDSNSEGQVWYNTSTGSLKGLVQIKAWSNSGNLPVGVRNHAGSGPVTAGIIYGGYNPPSTATTNAHEYSGYSWSSGGAINTPSRSLAGSGTQTAALKIMGQTEPFSVDVGITSTEEYDGSTWTTGGSATTKRFSLGGAGTQTDSIALGGRDDPSDRGDAIEEYNGTSWSNGTTPPLSKGNTAVWGNSTAALVLGGNVPAIPPGTNQTSVQEWDGSTWTTVNSLINRAFNQVSGSGTVNGGVNVNSTGSEEWDGVIFSTIPAMTSARNGATGGGLGHTWIAGGPPALTATEEYNSNINAITKSAWASGGNLNTARQQVASVGIQTASLAVGGNTGSTVGNTESYDGSSWTEVNDLNTARRFFDGAGTTTAAVVFGGYPDLTTTEEWDGTNWTSVPGSLNTGSHGIAGSGTQTAALGAGRAPTGTNTELYDGTNWTSGNAFSTARAYSTLSGIQTSSLLSGGQDAVAGTTATESFNGTSWTTENSMNSGRVGLASGGSDSTAAVAFGGPGPSNATEEYDGTSWAISSSMSTGRQYLGGSGTASSALAFGGRLPAVTNATEEFTAGTQVATSSTLSSS